MALKVRPYRLLYSFGLLAVAWYYTGGIGLLLVALAFFDIEAKKRGS